MSDKAAKMLLIGMLSIAAAILLGHGIYIVRPVDSSHAIVAVVNKLTGTVRLCAPTICDEPKVE
jgi:hypothetical protein